MMLQQSKNPTHAAALLLFSGGHWNEEAQRPLWIYKDHHGKLQGPFSAANMLQWYITQRLPENLQVCGITQQTATVPLDAIPAKFFQPLGSLVASTASGSRYSPLSVATAPAQSLGILHHPTTGGAAPATAQPVATPLLSQQTAVQVPTVGAASTGQSLLSNSAAAVTSNGQLRTVPQLLRPAAVIQNGQQVVQMAGLQQQNVQQPPLVLIQQPQQQQQQPRQVVQVVSTQPQQPQVAGVARQVVLQQPGQQTRLQQLPGGQIIMQTVPQQAQQPASHTVLLQQMQAAGGLQQVQQVPSASVVLSAQPLQAAGVHQQVHISPGTAQQQPVLHQSLQLQAQGVAAHPPSAATSLSPDMVVGQQIVERQLQQLHQAGRKVQQWAPVPITAQTRQYPGAEAVQQRLQATVALRGTTPEAQVHAVPAASQQSASAVSMRDLVLLALPGQHGHVPSARPSSGPRSVGHVSPAPVLQYGVSGVSAAAATAQGPATSSATNSVSNTPRQGLVPGLLAGSSFSSLQQLAQQASAVNAAGKGTDTAADGLRRSSAPGDVGLAASAPASAPVVHSGLPSMSLLSGSAGSHLGTTQGVARMETAPGSSLGIDDADDADAVIDALLLDLVEDVAADAGHAPKEYMPLHSAATGQAMVPPAAEAAAAATSAAAQAPVESLSTAGVPSTGAAAAETSVPTAGPKAVEFLHQQQLLQHHRLLQQQQQQQGTLLPQLSNKALPVLGVSLGAPTCSVPVTSGSSVQQGVLAFLNPVAQVQGSKRQPQQHQLLAAQQQQFLAQQQKLLAQAQHQQNHQRLLAQVQQQQQQQQLLVAQQRIQQQLAQQQGLREQLVKMQQQQQLQQSLVRQQQLQHRLPQQPSAAGLATPGAISANDLQKHLLLHQANKQVHAHAGATGGLAPAAQSEVAPQLKLVPTQEPMRSSNGLAAAGLAGTAASGTSADAELVVPPSRPSSGTGVVSAVTAAMTAVDPAASTSFEGSKQFNPFGMSFIDPQVVTERPQPPSTAAASATQHAAATSSLLPQLQDQPAVGSSSNSGKQLTEAQEREIMAALMPELAAMGMTSEQQLAVLKQMLGLKEQQQEQAQQQQQQQQQPQEHQALPAEPHRPQPSSQVTPQPAPPAAAQPQHVWLQQLAASRASASPAPKQGGDKLTSEPVAGVGSKAAAVEAAKGAAAAETGSDGEDFDPSMLPSDLFDFLDAHNSPKKQSSWPPGDASGAAGEGSGLQTGHEQHQPEQAGGGPPADKPGKYIPPGLRRSSGTNAGSSSSGGGAGMNWALDPSCPADNSNGLTALAAGVSAGAYQHPRARDRMVSPPPGFEMHVGGAVRGSHAADHLQPLQGERYMAVQQHLPPHLHSELPTNHSGDRISDADKGRSNMRMVFEKAKAHHAPVSPMSGYHEGEEQSHGRYGNAPAASVNESSDQPGQHHQRAPPAFEASGSSSSGWGSGYEQQHDRWQHEQQEQQVSDQATYPQQHQQYVEESWPQGGYNHQQQGFWEQPTGPEPEAYGRPEGQGWSGNPPELATYDDWGDQVDEDDAEQYHQHQYFDREGHQQPYGRDGGRQGRGGRGRGGGRVGRGGRGWPDWEEPQQEESQQLEPGSYLPRGRGRSAAYGQQQPTGTGRGRGLGRGCVRSMHYPQAEYPAYAEEFAAYTLEYPEQHAEEHYPDTLIGQGDRAPAVKRQGKRRKDSAVDVAEDANLTWQQQQLLGERSAAAAAGHKGRSSAALAHEQAGDELSLLSVRQSAHTESWGEPQPHEYHHTPPHSRRGPSHDHPAPQPSLHLREAAHNRSRQGPAAVSSAEAEQYRVAAQQGKPYAEFLKQLSAGGEAKRGSKHRSQQQEPQAAAYSEDFDFWAEQEGPAAGKSGVPKEAVESAAAAAMAAVQGLKPFCTVAPPRTGKAPSTGKKGGITGIPGSKGPQLPSAEETKAAVLAALGPSPSRSSSGVSDARSPEHQQEHGAGYKVSPGQTHLEQEHSFTSTGSGAAAESGGSGPPRRSVGSGSLFSSVIGQLRKQATSGRGDDMEQLEVPESPVGPDHTAANRCQPTSSYASAVTHTVPPPAASSSQGSGGRRAGNHPADIVLAAIQTTRQRAHGSQRPKGGRVRPGFDGGRPGKADAAWREADTANAWDSGFDV